MALKLFLALFATAGYALLVNVPRRLLLPAALGGMLSWGVYLLLKGRIESTFYLHVLVGAASDDLPHSGADPVGAGELCLLYDVRAGAEQAVDDAALWPADGGMGLRAGGRDRPDRGAAPDRELEAARKALTLLYRLYRSNARVACAAAMTAAGENIEKAKRLRRGEDEHDGACGGDAHGGVFSTAVCRGRADPGEAVFRLRAEGSV